jgi:glucosamine--fructose-6-phosphate aminotransferase (isomerizing)
MGLSAEIAAQPEIAERLLRELPDDLAPLLEDARRRRVRYVVIAARGTSDHAAIYAQYALGALAHIPVALATPSLFSVYDAPPRLDEALVIGISQSGRSPDVVAVLEEARRQEVLTVAITNDPTSPMAATADHLLALRAGEELSIAATKTYTAELVTIAMLAIGLGDAGADATDALRRVPDSQGRALLSAERADTLADAHAGLADCAVLGRGFNLATAFEWALKLKELAYVRAQAYSTADFRHGPVASLAPGGDVLAIIADGPLAPDAAEFIGRLQGDRRARVVAVTGDATAPAGADHLPFPDDLPEWLSPLVSIIPCQLFAAALARAKGLDVERPRGLSKVTLTR